jgi:hypothetical protein
MISSPAVEQASDAQAECRHHWVIDSARGPTSWGFCRRCAATREFANSCPGAVWENGTLSDILRTSPTSSLWWERLQPLSLVSENEAQSVAVDAC